MQEKDYDRQKIESKWQSIWRKSKIFSPNLDEAKKPSDFAQGKPFYNLMMFPYPSAEGLHVGNMYAFTGSDIYGRFKRMQGYSVFEPIGLDGFGIHSENYAIKVNRNPKEQAKISQKNFYRQLKAIGNSYDWDRTLETYDPEYYKWTQWIFIQLFKAGLAYRKKSPVNFCPSCKTVLADEQVVEGKCERCGTPVEKKELEQWFFRITNYIERLLEGLENIDWSEKVKIAQKNWIGRKEGATIKFEILNPKSETNSKTKIQTDYIEVFTTRPDTLYGTTFLVLAPEHELISKILKSKVKSQKSKLKEIRDYIEKAKGKTEQERIAQGTVKTGVFSGLYAINQVNGQKIPVWIADYVLMAYGTGAVMAVPAHDQRDFEFAKKFNLPIKQVITAYKTRSSATNPPRRWKATSTSGVDDKYFDDKYDEAYEGEGEIINSGDWNGWKVPKDIRKVTAWLENKGIGAKKTTYHLRDWLISRQRYWGPPIPMIFCEKCASEGKSWFISSDAKNHRQIRNSKSEIRNFAHEMSGWYPVPESDLPVLLPDVKDWRPTGTGKSPLASVENFVKVACPNCGATARRETDVSDTFLDSSWYFLRYLATDRSDVPFPSEAFYKNSKSETRNSNLFRASKFDIGIFAQRAKRWLPVNMYIGGAEHSVLHLLYTRFLTMVFKDFGLVDFEEPFTEFRTHGLLISKGAKMSKSKGNIVNPDDYIEKYGSDTLRCYLMFCGRFKEGGDFRDKGIEGMARFLRRIWRLVQINLKFKIENLKLSEDAERLMHKTIKQVAEDIESLDYNTAISALMIWLNALEKRTKAGPAGLHPTPTSSPALQAFISEESLSAFAREELTAGARAGTPRPSPATGITREEMETFLLLLAPFAPHMTEELWSRIIARNTQYEIRNTKYASIHLQPWPKYNEKLAKSNQIELVVQIDGKLRDRIEAKSALGVKEAEKLALASVKVKKYISGKNYKAIYVKDKLINLVLK